MKTSIKMLLVFVGIVLFLVLASDVVLWAYFKKGMNGNGEKLRFRENEIENEIVLQPFKAIVVNPARGNQLEVVADSNYKIAPMGLDGEKMQYKQEGDTLYILPNNAHKVIVYCPSVQAIRAAADNIELSVKGFKQSTMEVAGLNYFNVYFSQVFLDKLTYKGGDNNIIATWGTSNIDSVNIELGLYGRVDFKDVTMGGLNVKADSLLALNLDKWGLSKLDKVESRHTMKDNHER